MTRRKAESRPLASDPPGVHNSAANDPIPNLCTIVCPRGWRESLYPWADEAGHSKKCFSTCWHLRSPRYGVHPAAFCSDRPLPARQTRLDGPDPEPIPNVPKRNVADQRHRIAPCFRSLIKETGF